MRVRSLVPTHGRVYLHVLFCELFLFIGVLFELVRLIQTLTAVCKAGNTIGPYYSPVKMFAHLLAMNATALNFSDTHCRRCSESCYQTVSANVHEKSCFETMHFLYFVYFCD